MPIRFRCAGCGKPLSIATRKAGLPTNCPLCHAEVNVPAGPSTESPAEPEPIAAAADKAAPWFVEAQNLQETAVTSTPPSAPAPAAAPERTPTKPVEKPAGWPLNYQIMAGVGLVTVLLLLVALACIIVGPTAGSSETSDPLLLAQQPPGNILGLPLNPKFTGDQASPAAEKEPVAPAALLEAKKAPPTLVAKEAVPVEVKEKPAVPQEVKPVVENPEPIKVETVKEQPEKPMKLPKVDEPAPPPALVKFQVKRRTRTTDEDLRKQLMLASEVSLDAVPRTTNALIAAARLPANQGKDLVPLLAMQRADLFGLPLKMGHECHTGKEPAENLQALSKKLRGHLDASLPTPPNGVVVDPRPDPAKLRERLLFDAERDAWLQAEAIPTLHQMLMAENKRVRLVLVEVLAQIPGSEATQALAMRALVDLHPAVREAALIALKDRPRADYEPLFLAGFRYPWAAVADHAAEGAVALEMRNLVPKLIPLLDLPEPSAPFRMTATNKKTLLVAREVVRINHLANCLLCHPSSFDHADLVRGLVPTRESAPLGYGGGNQGNFVRADVTYLKQDFSVCQPVANSGPWPAHQRFDYLVRLRPVTPQQLSAYQQKNRDGDVLYPQKDAVLYTLRELTGQNLGRTADAWRKQPLAKFPKFAQPHDEALQLSNALVKAPVDRQQELLNQYLVAADPIHNLALAQAIPLLPNDVRKKSQEVLIERLLRSSDAQLREHLWSEKRELRIAAIHACGRAEVKTLVPELIDQLAGADKDMTRRLRWALEQITGQDLGPLVNATDIEREMAVADWRAWWKKHGNK